MNIAIIGAGHGGVALAAHFTKYMNKVTICADKSHPGFSEAIIKNDKYITVRNHVNDSNNIIKIHNITSSYQEALSTAEWIFIVTPAFAHEQVFSNMLPHLKRNKHKIVTVAGNFSTIIFNNILQKSGIHKKCMLFDVSSLPYACRVDKTGCGVDIFGIKNKMGISGIPSSMVSEAADILNNVFPTRLIPYKNSLEVGLNITSGISHPIPALFNAGRIGSNKEDYYFYKEGISEHTNVLLEQLDNDRRYIGSLYDLNLPSYIDLMHEFYGNKYESIYDFFSNTPVHNAQKLCPSSLSERYISQDVPYVIVPWYTLGLMKGYDSKIMRNIIEISSMINRTDYFATGINKKKIMSVYSSVNNFIKNIEHGCLQCFPSSA